MLHRYQVYNNYCVGGMFLNAGKETQLGDLVTVMQDLEKKWIGGPRRALEL